MKRLINKLIIGNAILGKKIAVPILLVVILTALVPTTSVKGVSTTLTQSYCTSPLNGSWATNGVCTIPVGSSGSIPAVDVLVLNEYTQIIVNGTLTVNGKFTLQGGTLGTNSGGTLTNNGAIEHRTSTTGGLNNFGTFNNNGSLFLATGANFANYNVFSNSATLTINGEFDTYAQAGVNGLFTNTNTGVINIMAGGYYFGAVNTSTTNYGTININRNSSTYAQGTMSVHGSLTNAGSILNVGIFRAKTLTNTGTLLNESYGDMKCSESFSSLINEGTFTNRYLFQLTDGCIFTNKSSGTFNNSGITYIGEDMGTSVGVGTLLNEGTVNNYDNGSIILVAWGVDAGIELHNENGAVITNDSGGVIEVGKSSHLYNTGLIEHKNGVIKGGATGDGSLANYRWETPWDGDPGVINKYCAGSILVAVSGPAPIDLCHGTIVIKKSTEYKLGDDFSFSGSGSIGTFSLDDDYDPTLPNTRTFSGLSLGSYTVTEAEASKFALTGLVCTSTEGGGDTTTVDLGTRTATIDLDGGETVTCTFTNSQVICTPPAVTTQPISQAITYGQNASFTVAGTNYSSVQWQVNTGSGWSNISGATSATYTLTKPAVSLSGSQYQAVLTGSCTPAATSTAATLTVNKAPVTATAGSYSGTYDGAAHSPSACTITGTYKGDLSCTNSPSSVGPGVGSGTITPTVNGTGLSNYEITNVNGTWSITTAVVTMTAGSYSGTYDGTAHSPSACTVTGYYMGDLSCTNSPASVGPGLGTGTITPTVNGTGLTNYEISTVNGSWSITPASLTASVTVNSKEYDGLMGATITSCKLSGVASGDSVYCSFLSASANFDNKNVGTNKTVTAMGLTLGGDDTGNYTFTGSGSGTASITAKHITGSFTAGDKVYDGNTTAEVLTRILMEKVSGDSVSLDGGTATFSDKNVGADKTITLTGASLTGTDAGNYILDSVTPTTADIQPAILTAIVTVSNKVYDGSTDAVVVSCSLNELVSGDIVACLFTSTISASFDDRNVGTNKTVTVTGLYLGLEDAGNYVLNSPVTTTADIYQRLINVNPNPGQFKVYGDADPTLTYTVDVPGLAAGDTFTGALTRNSGDIVGFYKITQGTLAINDGNGGANYKMGFGSEVLFEIKPKPITGTFTARNKVYDGTTAATVTLRQLNDVLGEDAVSLSGGTATFSDKNVGNDKTVTLTGASLIGTDAGNYVLDSVATTTANISKRFIIVRPVPGQFKIYGDDDPTLTYTVDDPGLLGSDSFSGALSRETGENVGFYQIIQGTLAINDGNDGANYNLGFTIEMEFQIKPKTITGSFTANDKVYDGTTAATVISLSLNGKLDGDDVSLSAGTATFSDRNVGLDKTVTLSGASLGGTDAGNYVLDSVTTTTADISVRDINVRPDSGQFKIYGDVDPTLTYTVDAPGLIAGDTFDGMLSRVSGEDVGSYEITSGTLTINDGNSGDNYILWLIPEVDFEIKAKHITGSFTADDKVYDGTTEANILTRSLSGMLSGDDVSLIGGTATFSDHNVGIGKTVTLSGASLSGNDATNYVLDSVATTTATITKANPICSINGYTGVYDGNSHGASGSCTGVQDETLAGLILGETFTNVPGGIANWAFTDETGNYNNNSGSGEIVITKADPTCAVSGYTGVYDGDPHGATGSVTGVKGEALVGLDLGGSFTNVPGGIASWSFIDETGNYNDDNGSVNIIINKADPTCSISGYTGVYDGDPHGASGSCTGEKGEVLTTLDLGDSFTNVPGGIANWTFIDTSGNYNDASGSVKIVIWKATLTITADNQTAQYSDATPPLTFLYSGFIGSDDADDIDTPAFCSTTRLISSPAGDYPITCSGGEDNNYTFSYVNGIFTVTKENATVTFDDSNPAALQVSEPGGSLDANQLTLVVKIKEKLPDTAAVAAGAGDINNAGLTVRLEPLSGGGAITLNCTASVEGTGYDGVKTFTCTNSQPLAVDTYDVVALINGDYYFGESYDGFTVFDPSLGYTTGGGWFYWPGTTEKTNFGFTMKYNKKATNIQGNLLVIRHHADGTISRLKSNALNGLALKDINGCGIATFSGKSTYETWDPEANEGLGGYVTLGGIPFSVYVEDCNEPGTGVDKFWVRGMDKLVLEKPAPTYAVIIGGGNIVVPHTPNISFEEPIVPKKYK